MGVVDLYQNGDRSRERAAAQTHEARTPWRRDYARVIHCSSFRRLQGKTQLFPTHESDVFRNRLTHSLEVAQIAKGIAGRLNKRHCYFRENNLSIELIETAALAHDLGHPPFGHDGELALDRAMKAFGGFESNAQTLRVLSKLEKKATCETENRPADSVEVLKGQDNRLGLNLCYRTLASILKYDTKISRDRSDANHLQKGYYETEAHIVKTIKNQVLQGEKAKHFKTVECSIMDVADDIAYSTYDLEDALKGGFLNPLSMLAADDEILDYVANNVEKRIGESFTKQDVQEVLWAAFRELFEGYENIDSPSKLQKIVAQIYEASSALCSNGYFRTDFTSDLIKTFMDGVEVDFCEGHPCLSALHLKSKIKKHVEVLKHFVYKSVVTSPHLNIAAERARTIIQQLFEDLAGEDSFERSKPGAFLPADFKQMFEALEEDFLKKRVVADFIAGMTDRYAVEFYGRLHSEDPATIFRPL